MNKEVPPLAEVSFLQLKSLQADSPHRVRAGRRRRISLCLPQVRRGYLS